MFGQTWMLMDVIVNILTVFDTRMQVGGKMAGLPALATSSLYPQVTNTILFGYHMSLAAFHRWS